MQEFNLNTTAILIFANSHGTDAARKNIPNSLSLFKVLNEDIVLKVKKTGLPYFVYNENLQVGSSFSARLTAAIQSVFSKGFERIITLGNDTPNLSVAHIRTAYNNVNEGKTVIGPSSDGGVYLLGFDKEKFDSDSFAQLPWQKNQLFQELSRLFFNKGVIYQLPRLEDIDALDDIQEVINKRNSISITLFRLLQSIIQKRPLLQRSTIHWPISTTISQTFNKGSPSFLS